MEKKGSTKTGTHIGRVHFPSESEEIANHDSHITVTSISKAYWVINLGFLQVFHRYHIEFTVPENIGDDITAFSFSSHHIKTEDIKPADEGMGHKITVQLAAYKEKFLSEKFKLSNKNDKKHCLTIDLNARVLGKGQGTPLLKDGIHCIGLMENSESEPSDSQDAEDDGE